MVGTTYLILCTRKWRNWQTRRIQESLTVIFRQQTQRLFKGFLLVCWVPLGAKWVRYRQ